MEGIKLMVDSAYQLDYTRLAYLDPKIMKSLRLSDGDFIEIEGKRRTAAKVWHIDRTNPWTDLRDENAIHIDRFTRLNAGVTYRDHVNIRKVEAKIAEKVVLAPSEGISIKFGKVLGENAKRQMMEHPIAKGDTIPVVVPHPSLEHPVTVQTILLVAKESEPEGIILIIDGTDIELTSEVAD